MERRLVLISAGSSFMVNAMIKNMAQEDFEAIACAPRSEDYNRIENRPKTVLVYIDKNAAEMTDFLSGIKDGLAGDKDTALFLIGSEEEIDAAKGCLGGAESLLAGTFLRPVNVKELCERLESLLQADAPADTKKHLLVVDDDGTMLRTLKLWLSDKYHVYMANSGQNALSLLEQKKVDLVLLDYEMPVADGPEVLRMIRTNPATAEVPVMFLTAKNDKESILSVQDLNPQKYLLKTMSPDALMEEIDGFFANK